MRDMIPKPITAFPPLLLSLLAFLALATPSRAQWYAPETNYHDPVQRVFPVELARVLAWRENAATAASTTTATANTAPIAEIRYKVASTDDNNSTQWEIRWLDAEGKTLRGAKFTYPAQLLLDGPKFYREITAKMLAAQSWAPPQGSSPDDLDTAFWAGLGCMKASRMATLQIILKENKEFLDKEYFSGADKLQLVDNAARLSGQLLSATVPGALGGLLTLDSTLAARGAAWLALAELGLPERDAAASDNRWAVVLWLARREFQAARLWSDSIARNAPAGNAGFPLGDDTNARKNLAAPRDSANASLARDWWSFMLTRHTARDAYLRATRHDDPAWGLPLLARGARLQDDGAGQFAECARILYPDRLAQAHDYAPWSGGPGGNAAGAQLTMLLAPAAREAWFAAINMLSDDEIKSVVGLDEALSTMHKPEAALIARGNATYNPAPAFAGILYKGGAGPLAPVSTVTINDMVNFGWELHGELTGTLIHGLGKWLGSMETARQVIESVKKNAPELAPFMGAAPPPDNSPSSLVDPNRFQRIEDSYMSASGNPSTGLRAKGVKKSRASADNDRPTAAAYASRGWLMFLKYSGFSTNPQDMQRLAQEGGPVISRKILDRIAKVENAPSMESVAASLAMVAKSAKLPKAIPANRPDPFQEYRQTLGKIKGAIAAPLLPDAYIEFVLQRVEINKLPPLKRAQAYERAFWADPHDDLVAKIFDSYIEAQATQAATRFYDHAVPVMTNPGILSDNIAPARLTLALLDGDHETAEKILKQTGTGSYQDYVNRIACAATRNDTALIEKTIKDYLARTSTLLRQLHDSQLTKLLGFLPLWPAITTPGHPDREKALDYFSDYNEWPTLQWLLIKQTKMPKRDAIRFLGGNKALGERQLMVDYLRGDKAALQKHYVPGHKYANMAKVVIHSLRADLLGIKPVTDAPDLSPPEPQSIMMAVTTARNAHLKPNINERLASLATEETLWNHIARLSKITYSETQDSRARMLEAEAAYASYMQRYPQGKHIWETRLWLLSAEQHKKAAATASAPVTAPNPAPPDTFDPRILEIINAPAAPLPTRLQAALLALRTFTAGRAKLPPQARALVFEKLSEWRKTLSASDDVSLLDMLEAALKGADDPAAARAALTRAATSKNEQLAALASAELRLMNFLEKPLDISFTAVDGRKVDSAALRGKVVILHFWATWHPPALMEIPKLKELYYKYRQNGLAVIGISLDVSKPDLERFITRNIIPWPNYFHENRSAKHLATECGVRVIPMKYLVDKTGRLHPLPPDTDLESEIKKHLDL